MESMDVDGCESSASLAPRKEAMVETRTFAGKGKNIIPGCLGGANGFRPSTAVGGHMGTTHDCRSAFHSAKGRRAVKGHLPRQ